MRKAFVEFAYLPLDGEIQFYYFVFERRIFSAYIIFILYLYHNIYSIIKLFKIHRKIVCLYVVWNGVSQSAGRDPPMGPMESTFGGSEEVCG